MNFSEEDKLRIIDVYNSDKSKSVAKIADEFNINSANLYKILNEYSDKVQWRGKKAPKLNETIILPAEKVESLDNIVEKPVISENKPEIDKSENDIPVKVNEPVEPIKPVYDDDVVNSGHKPENKPSESIEDIIKNSPGEYTNDRKPSFWINLGCPVMILTFLSAMFVSLASYGYWKYNFDQNNKKYKSSIENIGDSKKPGPIEDKIDKSNTNKELREVILSYLIQPHFSGSDFAEQILGNDVTLRELSDDFVYFSIHRKKYTDKIKELCLNPDKIEFGKNYFDKYNRNGVMLGNKKWNVIDHVFFRFPASEFKVDASKIINIPYSSPLSPFGNLIHYSINMQQLTDFATNKSVYGGNLTIVAEDIDGKSYHLTNHGVMVAKKGEKSLENFVNVLVGKETSKEKICQILLTFVTIQINYDKNETYSDTEILKRPNEVLFTRKSDCSGKTILYASLLEQKDIDYKLIYLPGHIAVAVEGNYSNNNDLAFKYGNKTYHICETASPCFVIGKSKIETYSVKDIECIQKPGKDSKVYDKNGKVLKFKD